MVAKEFYYIAAWGQLMQSARYYVEREQEKAAHQSAPFDAVFYSSGEKRWVRVGEILNIDNRDRVERFAAALRGPVWRGAKGQWFVTFADGPIAGPFGSQALAEQFHQAGAGGKGQ